MNDASLKILMLHNRYQHVGGEDKVTHGEVQLLRQAGHVVDLIEQTNDAIKQYTRLQKLALFWQATWNFERASWLSQQLTVLEPDLVHVQNFFPLFSPSIYSVAQKQRVPIIQHLHNFRLGCLNAYFYRDGEVCEACIGRNPWRGVKYRCYRGSLPASLSVWQMLTLHRWRKTWHRDVDAFITPSQFAAQKLVAIGLPAHKLFVKPNFVEDPLVDGAIAPLPEVPTFVFVGRLSPEKGVLALLQAWQQLQQPNWRLNIVGDGPQKPDLERFCQEHHLNNVTFWGFCSTVQTQELIKQATMAVVPSQWYETFGRVVIEAFACGRAVIASNVGAIAELVDEGQTGFKVTDSDVVAWAERLRWCGEHPSPVAVMGRAARQQYRQRYTPKANYHQLDAIYHQVLASPH